MNRVDQFSKGDVEETVGMPSGSDGLEEDAEIDHIVMDLASEKINDSLKT